MTARQRGALSARGLAAHALERVLYEEAYAAAVLAQALGESGLSAPDRALATELCYGVLRTERYLLRRIERHADLGRTARELVVPLLIGAYQLEFLDRVPAHAAVSESVELVRSVGKWAAGFLNAVLRKVASDQEGRLGRRDAALTSVPAWLRKRMEREVGLDDAQALLAPDAPPRPDVRVRPGRPVPEGALLEPLSVGGAFRFGSGGDPTRLDGFSRGDFQVQELGSQMVARLVRARPGDRVLDACAGRGQKTVCLLDSGAEVVAVDLHEHKLRALESELGRYELSARTRTLDFTLEPPTELLGVFDVVLVDAPCTGTGTLRRRPEIMRRLVPDSPRELARLQEQLLRQAVRCLAPGGRLIFSTCSVLGEEGAGVLDAVRDVLIPTPLAALESPNAELPGLAVGASSVRLLPTTTGTDGYFVAELRVAPPQSSSVT